MIIVITVSDSVAQVAKCHTNLYHICPHLQNGAVCQLITLTLLTVLVGNTSDGNTTTVSCESTHLTSFAVLVDVRGTLQVRMVSKGNPLWRVGVDMTCEYMYFILQDISAAEQLALQIVSYIGCGISVICLAISILYFLLQG